MNPRIGLGVSDFQKVREEGYAYIDKSRLLCDLIEDGAEAILVPRPRRFGTTRARAPIVPIARTTPKDRAADSAKAPPTHLETPQWLLSSTWVQPRREVGAGFVDRETQLPSARRRTRRF